MSAVIAPPHAQRAATARRLGEEQMQLALDAATSTDPSFSARAYTFIVAYVREQSARLGSVPGEQVTMAARAAGITPKDDRAFGAIYAKAIRQGDIRVVGACARVRGHGTAGGRLYAPGSGTEAAA
ncbi:hypothetical protein OE519_00350 [Pseudomonas aeruginosa]|nr:MULTISPECIES: hypothetical protein [Pseudomonadota]MDN8030320.1 hypothetical protein [Burkholderia multivorans]MCU8942218.1 hypothetical protein [Pseudomonas aeruginosa]OVZ64192.1 hypothetical protein CDO44_02110 [Pigmentiphaga sp. NML080357]RPZ73549.1 hypothetical protein IPC549_03225 [Pseudomonas aeruginosa]RUH46387.1 hypothetical protein IPC548_20825 [Pseudomonas aeruginosa]